MKISILLGISLFSGATAFAQSPGSQNAVYFSDPILKNDDGSYFLKNPRVMENGTVKRLYPNELGSAQAICQKFGFDGTPRVITRDFIFCTKSIDVFIPSTRAKSISIDQNGIATIIEPKFGNSYVQFEILNNIGVVDYSYPTDLCRMYGFDQYISGTYSPTRSSGTGGYIHGVGAEGLREPDRCAGNYGGYTDCFRVTALKCKGVWTGGDNQIPLGIGTLKTFLEVSQSQFLPDQKDFIGSVIQFLDLQERDRLVDTSAQAEADRQVAQLLVMNALKPFFTQNQSQDTLGRLTPVYTIGLEYSNRQMGIYEMSQIRINVKVAKAALAMLASSLKSLRTSLTDPTEIVQFVNAQSDIGRAMASRLSAVEIGQINQKLQGLLPIVVRYSQSPRTQSLALTVEGLLEYLGQN